MDAINPRRTPGIPGSVLHWHQTLPSAALQVLQGTWSAWAAFLPQRCSGSHVTFLPVPVQSWAPGEGGWGAQTWCSMLIETVDYLPYAVTAFLQGISHGVVVHIHTEVAICVVSWVEVGDHPRGNPQAPKHYKPRSVWGCWLWWRWHVNTPRYYPLTHKRHTHPYYLCWGSQQRPSTGQIGLAWSQIFSSSWGFLHCHSRSLGPGHQHNCHSNSQKEHRCHHCYWSVQKHPPTSKWINTMSFLPEWLTGFRTRGGRWGSHGALSAPFCHENCSKSLRGSGVYDFRSTLFNGSCLIALEWHQLCIARWQRRRRLHSLSAARLGPEVLFAEDNGCLLGGVGGVYRLKCAHARACTHLLKITLDI